MKRPASSKADAAKGVTLTVRIQPRASKNAMERLADGSLKIRLTAPPVDGAANDALVRYLAESFGIPRAGVEILSGHTARQKIVRISSITEHDLSKTVRGCRGSDAEGR